MGFFRKRKEEEYEKRELEFQKGIEEEKKQREKIFIPSNTNEPKIEIKLTEEEKRELAIYKRRLARGESEKSARSGLKTIE